MANYHGCFAMIISLHLMYLSRSKTKVTIASPFAAAHICWRSFFQCSFRIYFLSLMPCRKILLTEIYFAYYHFCFLRFCSFMLSRVLFFLIPLQFKLHFMQIIVIISKSMKLFFALLGKMCVYALCSLSSDGLVGFLAHTIWLRY